MQLSDSMWPMKTRFTLDFSCSINLNLALLVQIQFERLLLQTIHERFTQPCKVKFTKQSLRNEPKAVLAYFQATKKRSTINDTDVKVTKYVSSATSHASSELNLTENEITKLCQNRQEYQRNVPKNVKKEVGEYALIYGTQVRLKCSARNTQLSNLKGLL